MRKCDDNDDLVNSKDREKRVLKENLHVPKKCSKSYDLYAVFMSRGWMIARRGKGGEVGGRKDVDCRFIFRS